MADEDRQKLNDFYNKKNAEFLWKMSNSRRRGSDSKRILSVAKRAAFWLVPSERLFEFCSNTSSFSLAHLQKDNDFYKLCKMTFC